MTEETPAERARMYAEGARQNYEAHGNVSPMVALCCDTKVVMVMAHGETHDQPFQFGGIVATLAGRLQPHTIVTVAEVWKKEIPAPTEEDGRRAMDNIKRGDLGRMHAAGDTTIVTALMVNAWRLDEAKSYTVIDTVRGEKNYERYESEGLQEGHMADMVLSAWRKSVEMPPPDVVDDAALYEMLGVLQLADSLSIQEWDDDQPASN